MKITQIFSKFTIQNKKRWKMRLINRLISIIKDTESSVYYFLFRHITSYWRSVKSWKVKCTVTIALNDCGLKYENIEQATVSYMYGGTCCGQRALYKCGFTGIPIYNVSPSCHKQFYSFKNKSSHILKSMYFVFEQVIFVEGRNFV